MTSYRPIYVLTVAPFFELGLNRVGNWNEILNKRQRGIRTGIIEWERNGIEVLTAFSAHLYCRPFKIAIVRTIVQQLTRFPPTACRTVPLQ